MSSKPDSHPVVVAASRGHWWTPIGRWSLAGFPFVVFLAVAGALDSRTLGGFLTGLGTGAGVFAVPALLHCLSWLLGPARVRYEVRDREFQVWRGSRLLRRWPCDDVVSVVVTEGRGVSWHGVLVEGWLNYDSRIPDSWIEVRPRSRWDEAAGRHMLPLILCWGPARAKHATQVLSAAISRTKSS